MTNSAPEPGDKPDAIIPLVRHTLAGRYEDLSPGAVLATKTFILDSFGVIISGSLAPGVPQRLLWLARGACGAGPTTAALR